MVSIAQTKKKYHGKKAETYDAIRTKQGRWHLEHDAVEKMLSKILPVGSILDCPVGTGRFLELYHKLGINSVRGIDASDTMIKLAEKKVPRAMLRNPNHQLILECGDATELNVDDKGIDVSVCVRFLDLIDEAAMQAVMKELFRVSRKNIILTIRLGETYVPKSNTSEHNGKEFNKLIRRNGWMIEQNVPIFKAGWHVMLLRRK